MLQPLRNRLFLDTETDGVRRDRRVWDVGMVRYDEHGNRETWSMIVKDFDLGEAEPTSLAFGQFKQRHPKAGGDPGPFTQVLPEKEVAETVFQVAFGAVTAGIVVDFDTDALDSMLRRNGFCWTGWHHLVCVENRALGALQIRSLDHPAVAEAHAELLTQANQGKWVTDDIAKAFGIEFPAPLRHTAIGDAILAEMINWASVVDGVVPEPGVVWTPPEAIRRQLEQLQSSHDDAGRHEADSGEDRALADVVG